MITAGITGGIASGKSLVGRYFEQLGAELLDADTIAREVVEPGTPGLAAVVDAFGRGILQADGSLDREKLAYIIFADEHKRNLLNAVLHPLILAQTRQKVRACADHSRKELCVVEVPLLIECNLQHEFDTIIVVTTSRQLQKQRLVSRNRLSEHEAEQRISAQLSQEERASYADFSINNTGSPEQLQKQVLHIYEQLIGLKKRRRSEKNNC